MTKRILIVEDDKDIVEALRYNLEKEKFSVLTASTGEEGRTLALEVKPNLVILDIGLPGLDGYEVCRMLRRDPNTRRVPILMLTARIAETDKILGLELGADDYVTKPFGVRELLARVRAAIRRKEAERNEVESYRDSELHIDFQNYEVQFKGQEHRLTSKEFHLLKLLVQNAGRVLTRDKILDSVWGYNYYGESRTVDVHIRRIRKKLGPQFDSYLQTVVGVGYRFAPKKPELAESTLTDDT